MDDIFLEKGPLSEQYRDLLDQLPGGVFAFRWNGEGEPLFVNSTMLTILGADSLDEIKEYAGGDYSSIIYPGDREKIREIFRHLLKEKERPENFECRIYTVRGMVRLVRTTLQFHDGGPDGGIMVAVVMDMGLLSIGGTVYEMDALTGLMEREPFLSFMYKCREKLDENSGDRLVILYYDIVNFRFINKYDGMAAGDEFLRATGRMLQELFPEYVVARFSEDHFLVLTDGTDIEERVERSRERIKRMSTKTMLDCSIGACAWDDPELDAESICNRARLASDDNRERVGSFFSYYSTELGNRLDLSEYVVSHIDEAVVKGWIKVYYQPIVRAITGQLSGMEALARWDDPERGFLAPLQFIKPLENSNQIYKLDLCVVDQVCRRVALAQKQNLPEISFSVNLSRVDFGCCDMFEEVERIVRSYDIPRRTLHIENTESALLSSGDEVVETLDKFRKAGYEIWMDDFGSGYSNLNLLKDYSFDVLKLDMAFLRADTPRARSIIESMVAMDKRIGNLTIAEGVETREQWEFLKKAGCDKMQGYYFGKPLPYEESLSHCLASGMSIESSMWKNYYDSLQEVDFTVDLPMILVEYQKGEFSVLFMNDMFGDLTGLRGNLSLERVENAINDRKNPENRELMKIAGYSSWSGAEGDFFYKFKSHELKCRYRMLSKCEKRCLFEVRMTSVSNEPAQLEEQNRIIMALRYFYDDLYEIDARDMAVRPMQMLGTVGDEDADRGKCSFAMAVHDFIHDIFQADQDRYKEFIDPETLEKRVDESKRGVLSSTFRTLDENGTFTWKSHKIFKAPETDPPVLVYCTSTLDTEEAIQTISMIQSDPYRHLISFEEGEVSEKETLWDDLMLHIPLPVFWKDRNRRFLGASKTFLDYYGFDSIGEILGKTDEDVHWHPQNEPFKLDEEQVMDDAAIHVNVPGECIARGVSHNIMATKWPVYRNGKVCGLMGYFLDEDMVGKLTGEEVAAVKLDPVTGLEDLPAFIEDISQYTQDYQMGYGMFGMIVCNIPGIAQFTRAYGAKASKDMLKACADRVVSVVGNTGTVGRIGSEYLAVLYKYENPNDINELADEIRRRIESIHSVNGYSCTLFVRIQIVYADVSMRFEDAILKTLTGDVQDEIALKLDSGDLFDSRTTRDFLNELPVGCYIIKPDQVLTFWNKKAEDMLGYPSDQMVGGKCSTSRLECCDCNEKRVPQHMCPGVRAFSTGETQRVNVVFHKADGKGLLVRNTLIPVRNEKGEITESVGVFYPAGKGDIDFNVVTEIYEKATIDPVTGLPGRRFMEACVKDSLELYRRNGVKFAVFFADVDNLHDINNTYGHETGDKILRILGDEMRKQGRRTERLCRWGGDEFVAVIHINDPRDIIGASRRLAAVAGNIETECDGRRVSVSISVGITAVRPDDDGKKIVDRADRYMYLAKKLPDKKIVTDFNVDDLGD